MDEGDARLGEAVAAVALSAPARQLTAGIGGGRIVLIDADGGLRTIETSGMDTARLDWSEAGLFFADTENDYRLAEDLRVSESPKTDAQQSMFAVGEESIATYNEGFVDDGYAEDVVRNGPDGSTSTRVEGNYMVTGLCEDTVYGLSTPYGPYEEQAAAEGIDVTVGSSGFSGLMLSQLSGTADGTERLVRLRSVPESNQESSRSPCVDGVLYHLASRYEGDETTQVLRGWDVETGDMVERELVDEQGDPLAAADAEYGYETGGVSSRSIIDGQLQWVALDSQVMTTNITTGETRREFAIPGEFDPGIDWRSTVFTDQTLAAVTWNQDAGTATYVELDRRTGDIGTSLDLPDLADALADGPTSSLTGSLILRDLAVTPER